MNIDHFVSAYVRSMRLYYAFIIGISGWTGLACYDFFFPSQINPMRVFVILSVLLLAWGGNQVLVDYLDIAEQRIKTPHHPMLSGELPCTPALVVTILLLVLALTATCQLNALASIPLLFGILLTLLYRHAQNSVVMSNLVLVTIIAICPIFGFLAAGPSPHPLVTADRGAVLLLVLSINAILIPYTSFNKINTTAQPKNYAQRYSISQVGHFALWAFAFMVILIAVFVRSNMLPPKDLLFVPEFLLLAGATLFLQWWTGYLRVYCPQDTKNNFNLVISIRACAAGNCTMLALFNARLAIFLLLVSYILIEFLCILHRNGRA